MASNITSLALRLLTGVHTVHSSNAWCATALKPYCTSQVMELGVGADVYYTVKFNSGVCILHDSYGIYKVHLQKWILKKRTRTLQ